MAPSSASIGSSRSGRCGPLRFSKATSHTRCWPTFDRSTPAQSWVTALGVVLDAATLTAACVHGAEDQEPYLMYRRGRRAVEEISLRLQGAAYGQELAESRAVRDRVRSLATHGPAAARCRRRLGPPATPPYRVWRTTPEPDRLSGGAGWILGSLGGVALAHRWRRFQQHQQSRLLQRQFSELGT